MTIEELQQQNEQLLAMRYETLEAERQRYQELFEFSSEGYLVTDPYGIIQEVNHAAIILLKCSQSALVGKPLSLFVVREDRRLFRTQLNQLNQLQRLQNWEVRLQPRKGEPFSVALTVVAICTQTGTLVGLRWLMRDISERQQQEEQIRKALEQEKEFTDLQSRFIKSVSHQFRTPLTIIKLSAELLENYAHKLSEESKTSHFQKIRTATKQMTHLLDEILLLEKAEAGNLEVNPLTLDLVEFCRKLIEEIQLSAGSEHIIKFTHQGECTHAYLDTEMLRQILESLFSNAMKYSPNGSRVYFKLSCQASEVTFTVQDEGMGIPQEDQLRLFERFHRGKNVGAISGTGLGLAIVKHFVDLQGGAITVESQVGKGTTLTVKLPLSSAE